MGCQVGVDWPVGGGGFGVIRAVTWEGHKATSCTEAQGKSPDSENNSPRYSPDSATWEVRSGMHLIGRPAGNSRLRFLRFFPSYYSAN